MTHIMYYLGIVGVNSKDTLFIRDHIHISLINACFPWLQPILQNSRQLTFDKWKN